jgi:hypothetical protein
MTMYVIQEQMFRLGEDSGREVAEVRKPSEDEVLILASVLALDLAIDAEHHQ